MADGERRVVVGLGAELFEHELFPRRPLDGAEHVRVGDALGAQFHAQADLTRPGFQEKAFLKRAAVARSVRLRLSGVTDTAPRAAASMSDVLARPDPSARGLPIQ